MHAKRKITVCSHKHFFTPYPSLSPYSQMDRITDGGMNTLAARGLEEPFFQFCCCVSFFWFWWEIGFGVTDVLRVQYSCGVVLFFLFLREIVFCFAYVLHVRYSCAVVSVFWLWRERVFGWSKKNSYWISLFYRNSLITKVYFSWDPNFLILLISFLYCMDLQPYSHDCFSKISRAFFASRN